VAKERCVEELIGYLQTAGVDARLVAPLARYGALVLDANRRFNLTGAKTAADLLPHLLDSLTVVPYLRGPYVDIGSGAGLPAIPAAIASGLGVTMIEATRKKVQFLDDALTSLDLAGEALAERAEVAGHDERLRERFASGTARAVSSAPTVAELLLPLIAPGGLAILQRGIVEPREHVALDDACLMLGATVEAEHELEGERRIILIRKNSPTPNRFPRRTGIPEKRPLCFEPLDRAAGG
jgi:16S rRNA (guanine527-N7)-methyltransferase